MRLWIVLIHDLDSIVKYKIPNITMLTDSESLFNVMVKSAATTKHRLLIDVKVNIEAFEKNDMSNIG